MASDFKTAAVRWPAPAPVPSWTQIGYVAGTVLLILMLTRKRAK